MMRRSLGTLTGRGRGFVAAGVTALLASWLLDQQTLAQAAVVLLCLPLIAVLLIGRARYRLALHRSLSPTLVPTGQSARVELTLTNEGRTPTGVLQLEDQLPYALGMTPRFVVEGIRQGWTRRVGYPVQAQVRGRFQVGPMAVRISDPFGLVAVHRDFHTRACFVVTPRPEPLPPIGLLGSFTGAGDKRPRTFASGNPEDVTVREYRQGDDLRRVHWRSSARIGELMVRREEQPWQARATLFLDNRLHVHRGVGLSSSFETAVVATASIAQHLTQRGFSLRFVTASGVLQDWSPTSRGVGAAAVLEQLADLDLDSHPRLDGSWLGSSASGGVVIAVLGSVLPGDLSVLRRMAHQVSERFAMVLDVDAWSPKSIDAAPPGTPSLQGALKAQGWRPVGLGPRDSIAAAWQELGHARSFQSASPSSVPLGAQS